jgi:membrane protein YqaA with SNARE-associated domain
MDELLAAVQPYIDQFGGVGMLLIAALDTSFVSMPNVNDLLLMWQTIKRPDAWWYYALMTSIGSMLGSLVIYELGRRGGEAFLLKRFRPHHVMRVRSVFERYGLWAMAVVAFLPPPTPYKIFVLLAGVGGLGPVPFALSVLAGRFVRYGAEGWLARVYGDRATAWLTVHAGDLALAVLGVCLLGLVTWLLWRWRHPA